MPGGQNVFRTAVEVKIAAIEGNQGNSESSSGRSQEQPMNFKQASERVNQLSELPDNSTLLKLYSLYKQGSSGDVAGKRPGVINIRERAKWDAWKALAGMDSERAQTRYIKLVEELLKKDQRKR